MPNVLISAFTGEGPSDAAFLGPIIERTFADILTESQQEIDTYPPFWLGIAKGDAIVASAKRAAAELYMLYCIHADADSEDYQTALNERITPFLEQIAANGQLRPPLIPVLPVQETEAWMLSDTEILRRELITNLSANELGLHGSPERYADAKGKLVEAIGKANEGKGNHLKLSIADLYQPLGENIRLTELQRLPSYQRFRAAAEKGLREIGYLI